MCEPRVLLPALDWLVIMHKEKRKKNLKRSPALACKTTNKSLEFSFLACFSEFLLIFILCRIQIHMSHLVVDQQ